PLSDLSPRDYSTLYLHDALPILGIIYPEQMYIKSHPVYWQLQLIYMWQMNAFNMTQFKQLLELNQFYNIEIDKTQISYSIVQKFKQFYYNHGCYSVQKWL